MNVSPKVRTDYVGIKLTPEEGAMIRTQAAALGMTITSYLVGLAAGRVKGGAVPDGQKKPG